MNRGNRKLNARAVALLNPDPDSQVLDLGFGGGLALDMLLERGVRVTGVDRASDMVSAAAGRRRGAVTSGRLSVIEGDIAALPLAANSVDGVLTVNTVYFWSDLSASLGEIRRVLRPCGTLVIGIRDASLMKGADREIFTIRSPEEIKATLEGGDFDRVKIDSPSDQKAHLIAAHAS
jgi:ubiquinone/menaquinone biosynthesis C-methylase UbiE